MSIAQDKEQNRDCGGGGDELLQLSGNRNCKSKWKEVDRETMSLEAYVVCI